MYDSHVDQAFQDFIEVILEKSRVCNVGRNLIKFKFVVNLLKKKVADVYQKRVERLGKRKV